MSSRLDRLFVLIESGSSAVTRRAAAKQLGEVQKLHPHELHSLLRRIKLLLHSPCWDTRVAAGQAISAVVSNLPAWDPTPSSSVNENYEPPTRRPDLTRFDITNLLKSGAQLTGSEGTEYDVEAGKATAATVLSAAGIATAQVIGVTNIHELITAEDFVLTSEPQRRIEKTVGEVVEGEISLAGGLSTRERNRAKRRAKQRVVDANPVESDEPRKKKSRPDDDVVYSGPNEEDVSLPDAVPDATGVWINASEWPLQSFCEDLMTDLFSPRWESRHGAATGLREVLAVHGAGAGRSTPSTKRQMKEEHEAWLQEAALRVLGVLCLDRFGDFVSDQVVAPVRETCAQVLGALFKLLSPEGVRGVLRVIELMCAQTPWETRHGALLALKYCLSVRKELVSEVVSFVLPLVAARLYDEVDDVSGVAAAALVPVADDIVRLMPGQVSDLILKLWSLLDEQDDLAAASHSFMALLASLLNCPAAQMHIKPQPLEEVLPRLWKFIGHSSTSIRRSTLQTMHTLTKGAILCPSGVLQNTLRCLYQRTLFESNPTILDLLEKVWNNLVGGVDVDTLMMAACPCFGTWLCLAMQTPNLPFDNALLQPSLQTEGQVLFLGGQEGPTVCALVRVTCSRMLGILSHRLLESDETSPDSPLPYYAKVMLTHLGTKSALQRLVCGLVLTELSRFRQRPVYCDELNNRVLECISETVYFEEIAASLGRLLQDAAEYNSLLDSSKRAKTAVLSTLEAVLQLASQVVPEDLEERKASLHAAAEVIQNEQVAYSVASQAALASSLVHGKVLGEKVSPIIRPLMESVRKESVELLQQQCAETLALLVSFFVDRQPCPNGKIIANLQAFICENFPPSKSNEIITLCKQQRDADRMQLKRQGSNAGRGPGRPPLTPVSAPTTPSSDASAEQREQSAMVQRRGAALALQAMARHMGETLPVKLPQLWAIVLPPEEGATPELLSSLQVLEMVAPALHSSLLPQILSGLKILSVALCSDRPALRHISSRCFAALAALSTEQVMQTIVKDVVPLLSSSSLIQRAGAAEALSCVISSLQLSILPYVVLLLVPLLGRMTDPDHAVRTLCTQNFASLVQLMPLDGPHLNTGLLAQEQERERTFLKQLLNPSSIPDYVVPVPVRAQLRAYQQSGVNWLAFLNKYKLHGILCDDMGLGKTLQTICMLAGDHADKRNDGTTNLPSLVICPPTLTGHWVAEVDKFIDCDHLEPLLYAGTPADRERLRRKIGGNSLVVASYDIVRKDVDFFSSVTWNYCVLDEGHIIKNGKTKASKAIKTLTAGHRLILSGTPIQNNVLELWSLFDFLMPGFLGTERQFNIKFGRPILASRDAKVSSKEQEAGVMAMEALHRQVLPFLLRRVKEDVLNDLPPRITQDYICELSPVQQLLYEDFAKTQAHQDLQTAHANSHVFQALRYLQNVCNHPRLVLTQQHPQAERIQRILDQQNSSLDDINHACKLPALKQLLLDCGIGAGADAPITQHRALIFCQLKAMLDVVQKLLTQHLPGVSFLRLDGTVPPQQRHTVVHKFNSDPTIDVLLLTTHVGGLGLNLTGADTVIFVEHDWNPMKDLQAMDRAHRIGQKKVVNVYRLITKGTLEEKIMGLQKFKLMTANTVISQQNNALETMATHELLDLFSLQTDPKKKETSSGKSLVDSLPELWEQQQYEEEYDLTAFVAQMSR